MSQAGQNVDASGLSRWDGQPLTTTHPDHALLRLHGRNEVAYGTPAKSAAERFDYAYTSAELQALAHRYSPIARSVRYPHAVFNNCMEDKSQLNAREFLEALKAC